MSKEWQATGRKHSNHVAVGHKSTFDSTNVQCLLPSLSSGPISASSQYLVLLAELDFLFAIIWALANLFLLSLERRYLQRSAHPNIACRNVAKKTFC